MVCSLGSGRMAIMARLLAAGSLSRTVGEEVAQQKLAGQCIHRELNEAYEANLLDEEDMHVFGLKPMTDPLDLVCCKACKKPVKANQYTRHAELCRSLNSAEEMMLELDGVVGRGKPTRKEKKKLSTAYINHTTSVAKQERSVSIDADGFIPSEFQLDRQPGVSSSFSLDTKRNSTCVGVAIMMNGKGVSTENTDHSACIMPPPTKRSKLVSSQHLLQSNNPKVACGLAKIISIQDPFTCRDFQMQSTSGSDTPNDCAVISKFPGQSHAHSFLAKDVPVPLATKVYYSQKSNRLRSAVAHMYRTSSAKGHSNNVTSPGLSQESIIQLQASFNRDCPHEQVEGLINKKREPYACKPDQIHKQGIETKLDESGGCTPASNFSNMILVDSILRPQTAPVGLLRNKYLPKAYSFAGNSGQTLGTMQQPSGSVPVL